MQWTACVFHDGYTDFEVKGQGSDYSGYQMSESKPVIDLTERMGIKNMIIQNLVILSSAKNKRS